MSKSKTSRRTSPKSSRLWGVYLRSFDGYENVWKFIEGPFATKRAADVVADHERIKRVTAELAVKPI